MSILLLANFRRTKRPTVARPLPGIGNDMVSRTQELGGFQARRPVSAKRGLRVEPEIHGIALASVRMERRHESFILALLRRHLRGRALRTERAHRLVAVTTHPDRDDKPDGRWLWLRCRVRLGQGRAVQP